MYFLMVLIKYVFFRRNIFQFLFPVNNLGSLIIHLRGFAPASSRGLRQRAHPHRVHRVGGGLRQAVDGPGEGINLRVSRGGADFAVGMGFDDGFAGHHTIIVRHAKGG